MSTESGDEQERPGRSKGRRPKRHENKTSGFHALGLSEALMRGIFSQGFKKPTPVQTKTLPLSLANRSIMVMSRTGSGKTLAFLIPVIQKLEAHSSASTFAAPRAVILSPTRELSAQTYSVAKLLGKFTSIRTALIHGGHRMEAQFEAIKNKPDILISAPGRLAHLLVEMENDLSLEKVDILVFDEADRLFEMGFQQQISVIVQRCNPSRQVLMFSATLPNKLLEFARSDLISAHQKIDMVKIDGDLKVSDKLQNFFIKIRTNEKLAALLFLLKEKIPQNQKTVIFVATRHWVEFLKVMLAESIYLSCSICYSSLDSISRTEELENFRTGKTNLLVVTDVAARGLDIPDLDYVVNYHMPDSVKLFIHRVGRVARQKDALGQERVGTAYNFFNREELSQVLEVGLYLGKNFVVDESIGSFAQYVLDQEIESVNKLLHSGKIANELQVLLASCTNSMKLYSKTKSRPSSKSIQRAKELYPELKAVLFGKESAPGVKSFVSELKSFKPKETIFEVLSQKENKKKNQIDVRGSLRSFRRITSAVQQKKLDEVTESSVTVDDTEVKVKPIRNKPVLTQSQQAEIKKFNARLKKHPKKKVKAKSDTEQVYISYFPKAFEKEQIIDQHLESNIMELNPDESNQLNSKNRVVRWDKKKHKYISSTFDEHVKNNRERNEAGQKIDPSNRGELYKKWKKKTKTDQHQLANQGEKVSAKSATDVGRISYVHRNSKITGAPADEIVTSEQRMKGILNKIEKNKSVNQKGRKQLKRKEKMEKDIKEKAKKMKFGKKPQPSRNKFARSRIVGGNGKKRR